MTLRNNWVNGELFQATDINAITNAVNDVSAGISRVGDYGADPTGATDSLAALQQAVAAASAGDTLIFPPGTFLLSAELVINKPLTIRGSGGMFTATNQGGTFPGSAATNIVTSSTTANAIHITSPGVTLEDLAVVNTRTNAQSLPTAGTGVYMEGSSNFRLSRVTVAGFYDCVRTGGRFGNMDSCAILDPVRYGIFFTETTSAESDFGDHGISNCVIAMYGRQNTAAAAVRWEWGGGIRWTGNKIVAGTGPGATSIGSFQYGIDIMVKDGAGSGEFMISGGGISTCTVACIRLGQQSANGASYMTDLIVSGVVIQGNGGQAILLGAASSALQNNISKVVITGNTFKGVTGGGIVAYNMRGLVIGPNVWTQDSYTGPLITLNGSSSAGTGAQNSMQQVDVARQTVTSTTNTPSTTIINDKRGVANQGGLDGFVEYNYKRNVYTNTTGWVTMYTIEPPDQGGAGLIDVTLSGQDYGVTWFTQKIRRSYLKNNATVGGAITVANSGVDESTGATTYVGLQVVDGGSGKLLVQAAMLSGGTTLWGDLEINVFGRVQKFSIGAGI